MKKQYEKNTQLPTKVLSTFVDKESREWPPTCLGFFYQPMRPKKSLQMKEDKIVEFNK